MKFSKFSNIIRARIKRQTLFQNINKTVYKKTKVNDKSIRRILKTNL